MEGYGEPGGLSSLKISGTMEDLTTGPLTRHLLKTTSFMLVTMIFQTLYFLIDLYWVGRLGTHAVAAVGIAGNFTFIVLALTQMLGVGTTTVVSHAVGRKNRDEARADVQSGAGAGDRHRNCFSDRGNAGATSVHSRDERRRRDGRARRRNICSGSFRRWRCSS